MVNIPLGSRQQRVSRQVYPAFFRWIKTPENPAAAKLILNKVSTNNLMQMNVFKAQIDKQAGIFRLIDIQQKGLLFSSSQTYNITKTLIREIQFCIVSRVDCH